MMRSKSIKIRNTDPDVIQLTPEEYANMLRNSSKFDWPGWIKIFLMLFIPLITVITFLNNTDNRVTIAEKSIARNEKLISDYTTTIELLRSEVNKGNVSQGVILEKVSRAQKDIEGMAASIESLRKDFTRSTH